MAGNAKSWIEAPQKAYPKTPALLRARGPEAAQPCRFREFDRRVEKQQTIAGRGLRVFATFDSYDGSMRIVDGDRWILIPPVEPAF